MISDFPVMVDACVLVQAAVRDTLLRLFERRLFLARWTDEIIEETVRTLRDKLGRTAEQTALRRPRGRGVGAIGTQIHGRSDQERQIHAPPVHAL